MTRFWSHDGLFGLIQRIEVQLWPFPMRGDKRKGSKPEVRISHLSTRAQTTTVSLTIQKEQRRRRTITTTRHLREATELQSDNTAPDPPHYEHIDDFLPHLDNQDEPTTNDQDVPMQQVEPDEDKRPTVSLES